MLNTTYKRVRKYLHGDPEKLCVSGRKNQIRGSKLDGFKGNIQQMLSEGKQYKEIFSSLRSIGYTGGLTILSDYCSYLKGTHGVRSEEMKPIKQFINRQDIFKYIWSDKAIDVDDINNIYKNNSEVALIDECVKEFRKIFELKSIALLHSFIDKYRKSKISDLSSFANGLNNDIAAVENSVVNPYSNGILEGNNNRLKLIKRIMYGRAKLPLLRAKVLA